ncbi:MGMT family protein [archaeon]|nr:MGMT family protein [archaeon]
MNKIIALLKKEKAKRVLDLGCGTGRHTVLLSKNGFEVYAADISESGIKNAKKWLKEEGLNAKFKIQDFYKKFNFKDGFFDAVISTQSIHHNYQDKVQFCISEIERVLKPGGIAFVTVSASKYKRRASKYKIVGPRVYVPMDGAEKGLPHFIYTKSLLRKDFKNFKIISLHMDKGKHYCVLGRKGNTTKFQENIYAKLRKVPKGKVTTYGELAKAVKSKAYRAVGSAMNKNPYVSEKHSFSEHAKNKEFLSTPQVPCHRVVCSDGSIGGFASGVKKKIAILEKEGVLVKKNKIVDFEKKLYKF